MEPLLHTELEALEADVKEKLLGIGTPGRAGQPRAYRLPLQERTVRAGDYRKHPLRLSAPTRVQSARPFVPALDGLAHLLTTLSADQSGLLAGTVRQIVLVPELVRHDRCLLTNIFVPERALLAFYLFPLRLLAAPSSAYPERFRSGGFNGGAGLMSALIQTLAENADPEGGRILKFLLPGELIHPDETRAMQEIHDFYQLASID